MSLLEEIEIRQDQRRMDLEQRAIKRRDDAISHANELLNAGTISKELADKWIVRAYDEYNNPKGNLLEKIGGFLSERIKIAGENIAANQEQNKGDSLWNTLGENFRNMKQDDGFALNIPEQGGIDLSRIPQNGLDLSRMPEVSMDVSKLYPEQKRKKPIHRTTKKKHHYRK